MPEISAPAGPRRRRTRKETRHQIVEAAFQLFSQNGFSRTSVRDIAAAVGVTDAALYHHFASKKDLLDAVLEERGVGRWAEWIERTRSSVPLPTALERTSAAALTFVEQNRDLFRLVLFESLAGDDGALAHHAGMMRRWHEGLEALLTAGDSPLPDAEAAEVAAHLVAVLWGVAIERLLGTDPEPYADSEGAPTPRCRVLVRGIVGRLIPRPKSTQPRR